MEHLLHRLYGADAPAVGWESGVVICGKPAVTWFVASTNRRHSAFLIPHFTFRIPQFRILPIAKNFAYRPEPYLSTPVRVKFRKNG